MEKDDKEKKLGKGTICALIFISLFIIGLIIATFFFSTEKYKITNSIIILVCFLILIVLSNSFDNFSIGKFITISREVKENKEKVKTLEKEKSEILLKLVNLNFQSQNASNKTGIYIGNQGSNSELSIENIDEEEKKRVETEEKAEEIQTQNIHRFLDHNKFESLVLDKYFGLSKKNDLLRDIKVVGQFQNLDSISNKPTYFNAYLKEEDKEIFIDIRNGLSSSFLLHDRLYIQLNRILNYRNSNNSNAILLLLIAKEKDVEQSRFDNHFEDYFTPAKNIGLLNVDYIEYSSEEYDSCLKKS